MGFKEIRHRAIEAIKSGRVQHEARGEVDEKNLLLVGEVTSEQVVKLLLACKGNQHSVSSHHVLRDIEVHIFKPIVSFVSGNEKESWYIKLYLLDPDLWFISVHRSKKE